MTLLKLLHVLFVFVWIGNLLTLTRILGYFPKETPIVQARLAMICRRMYLFVDLPSMIVVVLTGLILFFNTTFGPSLGWFHMKLTFVVLLIIIDMLLGKEIKRVQTTTVTGKGIKFKVLHGVTALLLIGALCSIYCVRNKAQEIKDRTLQEYLGKNSQD